MALTLNIRFGSFKDIGAAAPRGRGAKASETPSTLVVFAGKDGELGKQAQSLLGKAAVAQVARAAKAAKFKGAAKSSLDLLAPEGLSFDRLLVAGGYRKPPEADKADSKPDQGPHELMLGGALMAKLASPSCSPAYSSAATRNGPSRTPKSGTISRHARAV